MPRVKLPLIGPSYTNRELPLSAQVSKNLIPRLNQESKAIISSHRFPGLKLFSSTMEGADRGMHVMAGVLYVVRGNTLYSINETGVATSLGTVNGSNRCEFANNGTQMMIATGAQPYLYSVGNLEQISDSDVGQPNTVTYINSQFVFDSNSSTIGQFSTSQVGSTLTAADFVDALDTATAEAYPDDILAALAYNQQVYFFGSESTEPWWNSGVGSPPFDRVQGATQPFGIAGRKAVALDDDTIFFLGQDRIPRKVFGLQFSNIGNEALGAQWSGYSDVSDCIVLSFKLDQKRFAVFTFPSANRSWIYNEESNSWWQLAYGVEEDRTRISSYARAYEKNIVGDHTNGNLYELDFDTYTDNGDVIQCQRATAIIHGGLYDFPGAELWFDQVDFDVHTGVGLTTGQGSDPQLMVRYSDDRGRTWSAEQWCPLGAGGSYLTRVSLFQQGAAHERIYELTYSEPTEFALFEAWANVSFSQ